MINVRDILEKKLNTPKDNKYDVGDLVWIDTQGESTMRHFKTNRMAQIAKKMSFHKGQWSYGVDHYDYQDNCWRYSAWYEEYQLTKISPEEAQKKYDAIENTG